MEKRLEIGRKLREKGKGAGSREYPLRGENPSISFQFPPLKWKFENRHKVTDIPIIFVKFQYLMVRKLAYNFHPMEVHGSSRFILRLFNMF